MNLPELVRKKLQHIPDAPGCYLMRNRQGTIIYVGKAASLRKRVQSYFRRSTLRRADPKLRGLVRSVADLDCIVTRTEAQAILTESRLIKDYKPRYNVSLRDDKRFLLLRGDPRMRLPVFKLCRIRRDDGALYFGPYASSPGARVTLDFVEKKFGIRKCAPLAPDESTYRHCLNDIIRHCAAPCVGKVTPAQYRERFDEACAFLRGERPRYLAELETAMTEASAAMQFERAAALRDTLFLIRETVRQRGKVLSSPELRGQEAAAGVRELRQVLDLRRDPLVIEAYDISNISGRHSVAGMVSFTAGMPERSRYRRFRIKTVEGADDPASMAEVLTRRFVRLRDEGGRVPDLVIVDGGLTQLRAARTALAAAGADAVPCAALAKRFEEIYWQDAAPPIHLPPDSRALLVLRHIRDEAHRYALAFHRNVRNRRIRESVLDEIPGVGPRKKQALLRRYGSVRNLAAAPEEDIARVPGIGYELARTIKEAVAGGAGS